MRYQRSRRAPKLGICVVICGRTSLNAEESGVLRTNFALQPFLQSDGDGGCPTIG